MPARRSNPQLDQIIAQSKQVTADLMAVRREAASLISTEIDKRRLEMGRDRLYLVIGQLRNMSDTLHDVWMDSLPSRPSVREVTRERRPALSNGQFTLMRGDQE